MLVESGTLDMTSRFSPVEFSGTLVHPFTTHSVISQTCSSASSMSALPHMLVGFGTLDMTSCFLPVQFSSTRVHPLITHCVISKTCSLVSLMLVLPHILVDFPLLRCRHSIHIQFEINAKSDFDSLDRVPTTPVVLVQFHVVSSTWCHPSAPSFIWSHPGWKTHHGKVELPHGNLACAS